MATHRPITRVSAPVSDYVSPTERLAQSRAARSAYARKLSERPDLVRLFLDDVPVSKDNLLTDFGKALKFEEFLTPAPGAPEKMWEELGTKRAAINECLRGIISARLRGQTREALNGEHLTNLKLALEEYGDALRRVSVLHDNGFYTIKEEDKDRYAASTGIWRSSGELVGAVDSAVRNINKLERGASIASRA